MLRSSSFPLAVAALLLAAAPPAAAQRQPTPEQRIERLERQLRQVQRRVFPKGQPVDTAGFVDEPAATQRSVGDLAARLDSIERQMAEITRLSEENGHRLGTLETELARLRAEQDMRWRAVQSATAVPAPDGAAAAPDALEAQPAAGPEASPAPPAPRPKVEQPPAAPPGSGQPAAPPPGSGQPAASATLDAGEVAYDEGYRLWLAGKYSEAISALRAMASSFTGHRRVSWANNLAGRALLDSGQPRAAAEALLANYRGDPRGERAADSLFYLGQALMKLNQPTQACKAYDELAEVYGATMRAELRRLLPPARAKAGCS